MSEFPNFEIQFTSTLLAFVSWTIFMATWVHFTVWSKKYLTDRFIYFIHLFILFILFASFVLFILLCVSLEQFCVWYQQVRETNDVNFERLVGVGGPSFFSILKSMNFWTTSVVNSRWFIGKPRIRSSTHHLPSINRDLSAKKVNENGSRSIDSVCLTFADTLTRNAVPERHRSRLKHSIRTAMLPAMLFRFLNQRQKETSLIRTLHLRRINFIPIAEVQRVKKLFSFYQVLLDWYDVCQWVFCLCCLAFTSVVNSPLLHFRWLFLAAACSIVIG